jgi:hypothetical protein
VGEVVDGLFVVVVGEIKFADVVAESGAVESDSAEGP